MDVRDTSSNSNAGSWDVSTVVGVVVGVLAVAAAIPGAVLAITKLRRTEGHVRYVHLIPIYPQVATLTVLYVTRQEDLESQWGDVSEGVPRGHVTVT